MKNILITGVNSYVGNSFSEWVSQYPETYSIDKISLRESDWKERDFSKYDSILHVAGIAHQKETKKNAHLYYVINCDLAFEVAQKAKNENVNQFIFLSSMSVYGMDKGVIDENTQPNPKSHYGKSKREAEKLILDIQSNDFIVAILRPPMIYGKGCKGNYQRLRKLALKSPVFPNINNRRSMVYIDNLSGFMKCIIDELKKGIYCPQNKEYVNTSRLVKSISEKNGKKIILTKLFNPLLKIMDINIINKIFGDLLYKNNPLESKGSNIIYGFEDTIFLTEKRS